MGKKIKLADAVHWVNERYDVDLTYQQAYMAGLAGRIPVERDDTDRFWLVDEDNRLAMAKALGFGPAKSKAKPKPTGKPNVKLKPATKLKPNRTARLRTTRLTA